ncbi:hypothetical protein D3C80_1168200 [compost metagenome]
MLPGPVGGRALLFGQRTLQAGFDFPYAVTAAAQQAAIHVTPERELLHRRRQHGLPVGRGGQLARQFQQRRGFRLSLTQGLQLSALAAGQVTREAGHEEEKQQVEHILLARDAQGHGRRDKQEVVGQKGQAGAGQGRAQTAAHRHHQHGGDKDQGNIRQFEQARQPQRDHRRQQGGQGSQQVVMPGQRLAAATPRGSAIGLGVEDADFQALALGEQTLGQAATEPATAQALAAAAHQDQAGAALAGMLDQGARHRFAAQADYFAAEALGQLLGGLQVAEARFVARAARLHMHHGPGQVPPFGHLAGMPDQAFGLRIAVYPDQ